MTRPDPQARITELEAQNAALREALDNLTIAIGMGWDLDGVTEVARAALAIGGNDG